MIQPDEDNAGPLREVLLRNTYVACEWDIEFFDSYSDPKSMNTQDHQSVQEVGLQFIKPHKLSDCIELFMKADTVKQKCEQCNSNTLSKKHLRV